MFVRPWIWLPFLAVSGCAVIRLQPKPIEASRAFAVPVGAGDRILEIRVPCGTVELDHGDAVSCEVEARAMGPSREAAEALAARIMLVDDTPGDGVCVVQLSMPPDADLSTRVVVAVQAPPALAVRVLTRRAMVVVHGYQGAVEVDSESGNVAARLGGGKIDVRTVTGLVRVHGAFSAVRVRSEAGDTRILVPATTDALAVDVEATRGAVDLEFATGGSASLDVRTRSGRPVLTDLPVVWIEDGVDDGQRWQRFAGQIGTKEDATRAITVVSESGRVSVRTLPGT